MSATKASISILKSKILLIFFQRNNIFNTKNNFSSNLSGNVFTTNTSYFTKSGAGSDLENIMEQNITKRSISPMSSEVENSFMGMQSRHNSNFFNINSSMDFCVKEEGEDAVNIMDGKDEDNNKEDLSENKKETIFENIEKKNQEIKDLFDVNVFEDVEENELRDFLEENGFLMLLEKVEEGEITQEQLINMPDEKILEYVEEDNQDKFQELRDFLMKLDEKDDAEDLLNSIDKTIGN